MPQNPVITPQREKQLIARVQEGDRAALGELLTAYQRRVYHVCLRMVANADDAAELTQETMLRAIRHADSFQAESKFSTWLMRIGMNLAISHLRKRKVRTAVSLDAPAAGGDNRAETALIGTLADNRELSPDRSVESKDQVERLLNALEGIDPSLRSVILLRDLQEMDYRQIAEVLAMPIGTVKSRLFRARLALRRVMEGADTDTPQTAPSKVADG